MSDQASTEPEFPGFPDFRANVTFVPLQFFTVALPHGSRGCVRIVGYMVRQILGWVDADGNPRHEQLQFTYSELVTAAGLSRDAIAEALKDALDARLIDCVQAPSPDREGQRARQGIYTLRWRDRYTNSPEEFDGFFRREAMLADGSNGPVAKAARKNIPNLFFDHVLRRERLSVIRVVGAMLFRSIDWGPGGERKVPVSMSITELCRLTRLTRRHVHEAVQEAMRRGYIQRVQEGRFDPQAGAESQAATYRIRWTSPVVNPVYPPPTPVIQTVPPHEPVPYPFSDRSEKGHGEAVGKRKRDQSEMGNGDRSEKGNDISIKRSIKNNAATAMGDAATSSVAADGWISKLVTAGFDQPTARHLAERHPTEVIAQQLAWLPLRRASTNRLGLLRRAIEQNWARPEGEVIPPEHEAGAIFARHYAGAVRNQNEPSALCSAKEALRAAEFLRCLGDGAVAQAADWGRRFAQFVRPRAQGRSALAWTLTAHGDAFAQHCRATTRNAQRESVTRLRNEHERTFQAHYLAYLRAEEEDFRRQKPDLYASFEVRQQELGAQFKLSEKSRDILRSEGGRLSALIDFMREHGSRRHDFWEWDRACNPDGWHTGHRENSSSFTPVSSIEPPSVVKEKGSFEEGETS